MASVCPEQSFSGLCNLGKTCFVSAILQSISTLTEIKLEIMDHFKQYMTCKQALKSWKIVANGKYAKCSNVNKILNNSIVHFLINITI